MSIVVASLTKFGLVMASDSMTVVGNVKSTGATKVWSTPHMLVGFVGCSAYRQGLEKVLSGEYMLKVPCNDSLLPKWATDINDGLRRWSQDCGHGEVQEGVKLYRYDVVLGFPSCRPGLGQLFHLDGDGSVHHSTTPTLVAVGSGREFAIGSYHTHEEPATSLDEEAQRVRRAVEVAICHSTWCGGPIKCLSMPRPDGGTP